MQYHLGIKYTVLHWKMFKRKSGQVSLNGPDAADKINNDITCECAVVADVSHGP